MDLLPLNNYNCKLKVKKSLGDNIIYVKDLKSADPYGLYINPRNNQKEIKKYTTNMIINTQVTIMRDEEQRYCFIRS